MLLVLSNYVYIEKEAAWVSVTMQKDSSAMKDLMCYIKCLYRYGSIENKFLRSSHKMLIRWKSGLANPKFFIKKWSQRVILYLNLIIITALSYLL